MGFPDRLSDCYRMRRVSHSSLGVNRGQMPRVNRARCDSVRQAAASDVGYKRGHREATRSNSLID